MGGDTPTLQGRCEMSDRQIGRQEVTQGYVQYLDHWPEEAGRKPASRSIKEAELFSKHGSKSAFALSMVLRPKGASRSQIVSVCGSPQMNKMRQLIKQGKVKDKTTKDKDTGHKVYSISLPVSKQRRRKHHLRRGTVKRK